MEKFELDLILTSFYVFSKNISMNCCQNIYHFKTQRQFINNTSSKGRRTNSYWIFHRINSVHTNCYFCEINIRWWLYMVLLLYYQQLGFWFMYFYSVQLLKICLWFEQGFFFEIWPDIKYEMEFVYSAYNPQCFSAKFFSISHLLECQSQENI